MFKSLFIFAAILFSYNLLFADDNSWERAGKLPEGMVEGLVYNHSQNTLIAGIYQKGVYRSFDGGANWEESNTGLENTLIKDILLLPNGEILIATNNGGIYKSSDNGQNWISKNEGLDNLYTLSLCISPSGDVFAGTWFSESDSNAYRSTDNGESWNKMSCKGDIHAMLALENDILLAGRRGLGVRRTSDYGETWEITSMMTEDIYCFATLSNGDIFCGNYKGIYKSEDMGYNWDMSMNGLNEIKRTQSLIVDKFGAVFAGLADNGGVYRSTDDGANWEPFSDGLSEAWIYSLAQDSSGILYAGAGDGVYKTKRSTNGVNENQKGLNCVAYPNPFTEKVAITLNDDFDRIIDLKIYDRFGTETGGIISSSSPNIFTWNPGNISSGIYFYKIQTLTKRYSGKIIYNK